ncbi:MAG: DUF1549 domain-containing protein [Pseudomonadota bacterium]
MKNRARRVNAHLNWAAHCGGRSAQTRCERLDTLPTLLLDVPGQEQGSSGPASFFLARQFLIFVFSYLLEQLAMRYGFNRFPKMIPAEPPCQPFETRTRLHLGIVEGDPAHLDTFDFKPDLGWPRRMRHGKPCNFCAQQLGAPREKPVAPVTSVSPATTKSDTNGFHSASVDQGIFVVLGMTVGCARCHDHKFDLWVAERMGEGTGSTSPGGRTPESILKNRSLPELALRQAVRNTLCFQRLPQGLGLAGKHPKGIIQRFVVMGTRQNGGGLIASEAVAARESHGCDLKEASRRDAARQRHLI